LSVKDLYHKDKLARMQLEIARREETRQEIVGKSLDEIQNHEIYRALSRIATGCLDPRAAIGAAKVLGEWAKLAKNQEERPANPEIHIHFGLPVGQVQQVVDVRSEGIVDIRPAGELESPKKEGE
jgi:class 3 adenylate cyclase